MGENGGSHSGCVSGSSCIDVWTSLVGVNTATMNLGNDTTSPYDEMIPSDDLTDLRAAWERHETWTLTAYATSTCAEEHRFGFSGNGGFLVLTIPAGASGDAVSSTDCVRKKNSDFAVRSSAAWTLDIDCDVTLYGFTPVSYTHLTLPTKA